MFLFLKREKWTHLKTTTFDGIHYAKGQLTEKLDGKIYIHYYESNKGNRKIECACSFPEVEQAKIDHFVKSSGVYQQRILRWLSGRYDPDIPRISEIGEEDTANALRGKVD